MPMAERDTKVKSIRDIRYPSLTTELAEVVFVY